MSGTVLSWEDEFGHWFSGQPVLVVGATGFIGRALSEALVAAGANVHALSRSASTQNVPEGSRPWAIDLRNPEATRGAVSRIRPGLVYHVAGMVTGREDRSLVLPMLEANLLGTVHLLLSVAESGCDHLVLVASSDEHGADSPESPRLSPYAAAKAGASLYARMFQSCYGVPVSIVRLFMAYGPGQDRTKLIPYTVFSLLQGIAPQLGSGHRLCDFIYILDVVRGLLQVGRDRAMIGQMLDLGTGKGETIRNVVELLVELTGSRLRPQFGAVPDRQTAGSLIADLEQTRRFVDWTPHWSLRKGLAETVKWCREVMEKGIAHGTC